MISKLLDELKNKYKTDAAYFEVLSEQIKEKQKICERQHNIECPLLKQDWEEK